jgi:cardiolipin synthase
MPPGRQGVELTEPANDDAGLWTVANVVSLLRLAAVPVFLWVLLGLDEVAMAAWILLVIGLTDWLDGSLARALGQVSEIGKFLDPLADRTAIVAAVIGGLIAGVVPGLIAWPLLIREAVVAVGALLLIGRLKENVEVKYLGKLATFIVYGAIPAFYLASAGVEIMEPIAWISGVIGLVLYYAVTIDYARDVLAKLNAQEAGR